MIVTGTLLHNDGDKASVSISFDEEKRLISSYLEEVICHIAKNALSEGEYKELLEISEWDDYVSNLTHDVQELLDNMARSDFWESTVESAKDILERNKYKYYEVTVDITTNYTFYIRARSHEEAEEVIGYDIDAKDITESLDALSDMDWTIGESVDHVDGYDAVYDTEEKMFI